MINIYKTEDIAVFKEGGKILAEILDELIDQVKEGTTGKFLDQRARELIKKYRANPSFLGYRNFPAALCVSVNEQLVHGVPKGQEFKRDDLVSLDLGIKYKGFCTDKAVTVLLGKRDEKKEKFLLTVKQSLNRGIKKLKRGNRLGAFSETIQNFIEGRGYKVIRALSGHGIGREVHEEPRVFNFGKKSQGPILKEGMVLAVEPMAAISTSEIKVENDQFTISSKDGSLSCHFEDTIAITKNGPIILTRT